MHFVGLKYCMRQYHQTSIQPFAPEDKQNFPLIRSGPSSGEGNWSLDQKLQRQLFRRDPGVHDRGHRRTPLRCDQTSPHRTLEGGGHCLRKLYHSAPWHLPGLLLFLSSVSPFETLQGVEHVFIVGVGGGVPHYTDWSRHVSCSSRPKQLATESLTYRCGSAMW